MLKMTEDPFKSNTGNAKHEKEIIMDFSMVSH